MNTALLAAGALTILIGLVHSILGEIMIFRALRQGNWIPTHGGSALREHQVRIIWASWHVVSVLGWALAAMLLRVGGLWAMPWPQFITQVAIWAVLISAALILIGTRGKHPAWIGLLVVAALLVLS
jgi:hypothetical protein